MVRSLWVVSAVLAVAAAAPAPRDGTTEQQPFTLEDFLRGRFSQRAFNGRWISDTQFTFTVAGEPGIQMFDVSTLTKSVLVSGELMATLNTTSPILSADKKYILAPSEVKQVYRYSTTAKYTLFEIATQTATPIAGHDRLQLCIFGAGHSVAFVRDNDLYYQPSMTAEPIWITQDGKPGVIYNGHTDWVYEEDVMYTGQATWFSKDGSYLAFASFDDTNVETYSYYYYEDKEDPDDPYPELFDLKYPKAGRTNPSVKLRVVNLSTLVANSANQNRDFINLAAPDVVTNDHILGGVTWSTDNEVVAHWLNRRQNRTVLRFTNVVTGAQQEEHRSQPEGWVPAELPRFNRDGSSYVSLRWSLRQADGLAWQHLVQSVRLGDELHTSSITPGAFTVMAFVGMDETNLAYYYQRTVSGQPWRAEVHRAGAHARCVSCGVTMPGGGQCSWASASASTSARYLAITCASPTEPSATYLVEGLTGKVVYDWETNAIVRERLVNKVLPKSIIGTVPLESGHPAPYRLHLPPGLDENDHTKKYPLVFYVYSGPNTNNVVDTFTVGYHSVVTTNHDTIYMVADGRGAGRHGQDILYAINNNLGTVEIEDHFVILKQVLDRYGFIDSSRVSIWGHSYGGYATLLTLATDTDHVFQCGVSTAPVTSWLYYNTMYTERYMGMPTVEDNLFGYEAADVTLDVERLRGHDFYLMHGNADDNVHYQNAVKLFTNLQERDIPFQQMSYPDEAHSLTGVNMHRYNTMNKYWQKCIGMPEAKYQPVATYSIDLDYEEPPVEEYDYTRN